MTVDAYKEEAGEEDVDTAHISVLGIAVAFSSSGAQLR